MTSEDTEGLPVRPQQPPPTDVVQQQLRLLVQAISAAPTTARAEEMINQVADLGGWADSLMEVGTQVVDGDQEYIVGKPARPAPSLGADQ